MKPLFEIGERIGFVRSLACWFVWIAVCGLFARAVEVTLYDYPRLATVAVLTVAIVAVIAGLVGAWVVMQEAEFWYSGYRIRWTGATSWLYDERAGDRSLRSLVFVREFLDKKYPASSRIIIPDEANWSAHVPEWARERREEIVSRIRARCGANAGAIVDVAPP